MVSAVSGTQTGARLLIHLAEDQCGLLQNAGLAHLADEVVALTGTLADAGEHGHAAVVLGDALDHLLDQHGLADACTTEQTDLAALHVRGQQIDDLDAGFEHLGLGLQLVECRRLAVDGPAFGDLDGLVGLLVQHVTGHVEHVAQGHVADGHGNRAACVVHRSAADEAVGGLQGHGAHGGVAKVLLDLKRDRVRGLAFLVSAGVGQLDGQGVVDIGQVAHREFDVDNRTLDTRHTSIDRLCSRLGSRCGLIVSHMRSYSSFVFSASALPMISVSSWVMDA